MKRKTAKPAPKVSAVNTLERAHAEADAWRLALRWKCIAFEMASWQQIIPLLGKMLPDELDGLRGCCPDAAPAFEAVADICHRLAVSYARDAQRLRRERGAALPGVP